MSYYGVYMCIFCVKGDGPIAVVLAPTRELVQQIARDTKIYAIQHGVGCVAVYGGAPTYEQVKALKTAPEIIVATPGRLIDMIKEKVGFAKNAFGIGLIIGVFLLSKATNLRRCTFLVLDEADRMLDMGFSLQVNSIVDHVSVM